MTHPSSPTPPAATDAETFQQRVRPWMMECFGEKISADIIERNHRFLEEALELVQACHCTQDEAHQLVDYVYGRDQGDINQEVGGVMVTLAAHCLATGVDMHDVAETELARIWTKVEQIRAKQAAKPKHSPLPEALPTRSDAGLREALEKIEAKIAQLREYRDNFCEMEYARGVVTGRIEQAEMDAGFFRAALSASPETIASPVSGWQDIATAPDDDRDILVGAWVNANEECGFDDSVHLCWKQVISSRDDRSFRRGYRHRNGACWATHWHRLPVSGPIPLDAPPVKQGEGR